MNLAQLLHAAARRLPQAPAIALGTRSVATYGQLAARVARLAAGLLARHGLRPGDRVALAMKNCAAYYEVLFACWHAGLAAVPINAKLHPRELAYIIGNSGSRLCFATPELAGAIAGCEVIDVASPGYAQLQAQPGAPADVQPQELAWLFYTSGTTGMPKGAMLTHRNLLFATQAYYADIDRLAPGDSILHAAPLSHGSGLYGLPHFGAGALNVIPESGGFEPEEIFRLIAAHRGVSFFAAPTMIVRLLASRAAGDADLANLKTVTYGGAPMYLADALRAIDLFGPRLYQLFGQGESPMTISGLPQSDHAARAKLETCGFGRTGVEVRVVDAGDRDLPEGEAGEILTRSDCVMAGYWQNPEATAQTLRGGWLHTGDVGSLDAAGYLTIRDRSKDMIISGGSNIYPREIEEVLLKHPAVAECSVVGRPHPEWGEEVVAFVVRSGDVSAQQLDALCLEHIARFKRPRDYRFVDALPKNNYGKVLKTELRRLLSPPYSLKGPPCGSDS
jgi:long-chain acyl-CoA synthetase